MQDTFFDLAEKNALNDHNFFYNDYCPVFSDEVMMEHGRLATRMDMNIGNTTWLDFIIKYIAKETSTLPHWPLLN